MASPLKGTIAKAIGKALKAITFPVTLRRVTTTSAKSGAAYAIGVSTINVTGCPAGWTGVVPGDQFGTYPYTVTNTVVPVAGTMTGVTFTPALTLALTSGSALTFTHNTDYVGRGFDSLANAFNMPNTTIQANDWKICLMADGLPTPPAVNDRVITRTGRTPTIVSVALDPAGAVYVIQAR